MRPASLRTWLFGRADWAHGLTRRARRTRHLSLTGPWRPGPVQPSDDGKEGTAGHTWRPTHPGSGRYTGCLRRDSPRTPSPSGLKEARPARGSTGAWSGHVLDGNLPTAPTVALAAARRYRTVLKTPGLSAAARSYLQVNLDELERRANDPARLDEEVQRASEQTQQAEARNEVGVYVYALPHYIRHPYDQASGRTLLKVGHSDSDVIVRFRSQTRTTALPEEPILLRIYRDRRMTPRRPPREPSIAFWTPLTTTARPVKAPAESGSLPTPGSSTRSPGPSASASTSSTRASLTTTDCQHLFIGRGAGVSTRVVSGQ